MKTQATCSTISYLKTLQNLCISFLKLVTLNFGKNPQHSNNVNLLFSFIVLFFVGAERFEFFILVLKSYPLTKQEKASFSGP